jgi:protocatechuate 3,4-dioxygenase beta subunit
MKSVLHFIFCLLLFCSSCQFERHFDELGDRTVYESFQNLPSSHQLNLLRIGEAGQSLNLCLTLINGTDGTLLKRKKVEVYHANAKGEYLWQVPGDKKTAKLKGMSLTDDKGRIFIQTLLPGEFGSSNNSRRIHLNIEGVSHKQIDLLFCQYADQQLQKQVESSNDQFLIELQKDERSTLIGISELTIGLPPSNALQEGNLPDCEWCGTEEAPANVSSRTQIALNSEPGQSIELSGKVYLEDGKTPAQGVIIYAYHTDATGQYALKGNETGNGKRHGHLRGWVKTDEKGRYFIRTIKPAPYPSRKEPAHIHMTLQAPGGTEFWIPSTLFAGDPLIAPKDSVKNGVSSHIVHFKKANDGVLYGKRDIVLEESKS